MHAQNRVFLFALLISAGILVCGLLGFLGGGITEPAPLLSLKELSPGWTRFAGFLDNDSPLLVCKFKGTDYMAAHLDVDALEQEDVFLHATDVFIQLGTESFTKLQLEESLYWSYPLERDAVDRAFPQVLGEAGDVMLSARFEIGEFTFNVDINVSKNGLMEVARYKTSDPVHYIQ